MTDKVLPFKKAIKVDVPEDSWEPTGPDDDRTARLLMTLIVCGCFHHLEAYAVKEAENGVQVAAHPMFESNLDGIFAIGDEPGVFDTVEIKGRKYVLTMTPYC